MIYFYNGNNNSMFKSNNDCEKISILLSLVKIVKTILLLFILKAKWKKTANEKIYINKIKSKK